MAGERNRRILHMLKPPPPCHGVINQNNMNEGDLDLQCSADPVLNEYEHDIMDYKDLENITLDRTSDCAQSTLLLAEPLVKPQTLTSENPVALSPNNYEIYNLEKNVLEVSNLLLLFKF